MEVGLEAYIRQRFEAIVREEPFSKSVDRLPFDLTLTAWPGHYKNYQVQFAWDVLVRMMEEQLEHYNLVRKEDEP